MDFLRMRARMPGAIALILITGIAACSPKTSQPVSESEVDMAIQLTSTAFRDGEKIPKKHSCDGQDISPQLAWSSAPAATKSLALIMDDPDAPIGTWVHWVLFDIDPQVTELPEGATGIGVEGKNSWRRTGYGGPCPPPGKPHRYFFKLYALDMRLGLQAGATKAEVENAMQNHILVQSQVIGNYGR